MCRRERHRRGLRDGASVAGESAVCRPVTDGIVREVKKTSYVHHVARCHEDAYGHSPFKDKYSVSLFFPLRSRFVFFFTCVCVSSMCHSCTRAALHKPHTHTRACVQRSASLSCCCQPSARLVVSTVTPTDNTTQYNRYVRASRGVE